MSVYKNSNFVKDEDFEIPDSRYSDIASLLKGQCLFLDAELSACWRAVKSLYDIFKVAKKRFDRRDTLQVSSSVAQFYQFTQDSVRYPYVLYDFIHKSDRICIVQNKGVYKVFCSSPLKNFEPDESKLFYGHFDNLSDCVNYWFDMVRSYLSVEELPF